MNRNFKLAVAIAAFVSGVNLAPAADKIPDATLDLSGGTVAAGVGYTWGRGTLHYRGRDYSFSVNGLTLINVGVGIATGLICAVTGMPNPAGLGALAAALNFIPIIGPVAMFVILVVVGLVAFPTIGGGLMAGLAFGGITFLEGHFVTPTIIGRRLSLNALAVFIALAFWTWLWGPMGAFLSSPLLIVGLILKEHLLPENSPQLPQA